MWIFISEVQHPEHLNESYEIISDLTKDTRHGFNEDIAPGRAGKVLPNTSSTGTNKYYKTFLP